MTWAGLAAGGVPPARLAGAVPMLRVAVSVAAALAGVLTGLPPASRQAGARPHLCLTAPVRVTGAQLPAVRSPELSRAPWGRQSFNMEGPASQAQHLIFLLIPSTSNSRVYNCKIILAHVSDCSNTFFFWQCCLPEIYLFKVRTNITVCYNNQVIANFCSLCVFPISSHFCLRHTTFSNC